MQHAAAKRRQFFSTLTLSCSVCLTTLTACQQHSGAAEPSLREASAQTFVERPILAQDFVDSVGVQTHISYLDTPYAQWGRVMQALGRLGVRHIRDGLAVTPDFLPKHWQLADRGIGCTCGMVVDFRYTSEFLVHAALQSRDVEALEAPNECDAGSNCGGGGEQGVAHVIAMLPVLHAAAQQLRVPLLGPSFTLQSSFAKGGSLARYIDVNNLHVYLGDHYPGSEGWGAGDRQNHRYGSIAWWQDQAESTGKYLPVTITESGYRTASSADSGPGTIPEEVEADYTPRTLLLAYQAGIHHTFLYELLDEFPSTGYGLLRHDLTEKPAYTAVRNLLALLQDSGTTSVAPLRFAMTAAGYAPEVRHMVLAKHDGTYALLLWLEVSSYDQDLRKSIAVTPQQVMLSFPAAQVQRQLHFTGQGTVQEDVLNARRAALPVTVTEHLTYLEIRQK